MNNTSVDSYLRDGCGRCDKFQTPECKVHLWTDPLIAIREMLNATELTEHMKWGQPTYALDGSNVLMIVSRNDFCGISFFKGAALDAPDGVLIPPGPNSHYARYIKFTSLDELESRREGDRRR